MAESQDVEQASPAEAELPVHWRKVQGAIWLIGIAVLAFTGWWWPGILLVVAASGLAEAAIRLYVQQQQEKVTSAAAGLALEEQRAQILPDKCPSCGSPATVTTVQWVGPLSAKCAFCGTAVTRGNLQQR